MKAIIVCMILLISPFLNAQKLPVFNSNTNSAEKMKSVVYSTYSKKYDAVISYERACALADPSRRNFFILAGKKNKWKFFAWELELLDGTSDQKKIKKATVKELPLNGLSVDSLLTYWTQQSFWTLNNDSLNLNVKNMEDGSTQDTFTPDGCTEIIETFTKKKYHVVKVLNADHYQDFVYTKQRQQFINCRNQFHQLSLNN